MTDRRVPNYEEFHVRDDEGLDPAPFDAQHAIRQMRKADAHNLLCKVIRLLADSRGETPSVEALGDFAIECYAHGVSSRAEFGSSSRAEFSTSRTDTGPVPPVATQGTRSTTATAPHRDQVPQPDLGPDSALRSDGQGRDPSVQEAHLASDVEEDDRVPVPARLADGSVGILQLPHAPTVSFLEDILLAMPGCFSGTAPTPELLRRDYLAWKKAARELVDAAAPELPTARDRILYVAGTLRSVAWTRVRSKVDSVSDQDDPAKWPIGWGDYDAIFRCLDRAYLPSGTATEAERRFHALRNRGKLLRFANFAAEFCRLAAEAGINPTDQVAALQHKVSAALWAQLQVNPDRPDPDDVDGWLRLFQRYDDNLVLGRARSDAVPGEPLDPDAPTASSPRPTDPGTGLLSAAERLRRRQEQLCMYCGASGHFVADCEATRQATPADRAAANDDAGVGPSAAPGS